MDSLTLIDQALEYEIDPAFSKRAQSIIREVLKTKPKRILDAGCGRGFYTKLLSCMPFPNRIIGVDIGADYLEIAKNNTKADKRVSYINSSLSHIPLPDNSIDCIICSEVLEHVEDDRMVLKELHRILAPGGSLLISVPNNNFPFLWDPINWILMKFFSTHINKNIWWLAGIWADHDRLYTETDIKKLIREKFTIKRSEKILHWCWPFSHFLLYGVGKNIVLRLPSSSYNRFEYKKGIISYLLAKLFRLPSYLDKMLPHKKNSVNFVVVGVKA